MMHTQSKYTESSLESASSCDLYQKYIRALRITTPRAPSVEESDLTPFGHSASYANDAVSKMSITPPTISDEAIARRFGDRIYANVRAYAPRIPFWNEAESNVHIARQSRELHGILNQVASRSERVRDIVLKRVSRDRSSVRQPLRSELTLRTALDAGNCSRAAQAEIGENLAEELMSPNVHDGLEIFHSILQLSDTMAITTDAPQRGRIAHGPAAQRAYGHAREIIFSKLEAYFTLLDEKDRLAAFASFVNATAKLPPDRAIAFLRSAKKLVQELPAGSDQRRAQNHLIQTLKQLIDTYPTRHAAMVQAAPVQPGVSNAPYVSPFEKHVNEAFGEATPPTPIRPRAYNGWAGRTEGSLHDAIRHAEENPNGPSLHLEPVPDVSGALRELLREI